MLIIAGRIIWQMYPNLWCCIGFWCLVLWLNRPERKSLQTIPVFVGALCNAVATIANGGKMPVLGKYGSPVSVWRAARLGDHVLILCDRFAGFSIGDVLIGIAFIFVIGVRLRKLMNPGVPSETQHDHDSKGVHQAAVLRRFFWAQGGWALRAISQRL